MASKVSVYDIFTERFIKALEEGTVPWHKPWKTLGGPRNLQSKRPYRGINAFMLTLSNHQSPYWTTYKKATENGGIVRKGEKGMPVVFWKPLKVDDKDNPGQKKTIPLLRYYTVFNVEQIEWNDEAQVKIDKLHEDLKQIDFEPIEEAQRVIDEMQNRPLFEHGSNGAGYNYIEDHIRLPHKNSFESNESYYTTAFHELAHSTGHESRLHRVKDWSLFGSDPYAKEELVAEMTSAFVSGTVGMESDFEQSAAYIAGWLRKFENDPKMIIHSAAAAQKAADYILNINDEREPSEAPAQETVAA